ncbi:MULTISPECIES: hypothetical protein [Leuconostoc]|uniref:Uncharacterized protein n=2 Tax=Leuconostoc kimchii TaxID=136609 RepID=D5T1V2_LEUKI|nr:MULTISPECIES: hypothetical protein [Leuconostoc]ADG40251.1 hypothetical protein LKI_03545 [Leuconostoc kimchii IMSNU 11154]AEJ31809.1 hypothetical protein LGMK_08800 [Leuconostoc sp. C2]QBR46761.1 hypothetical protein EW139_00930 [Leuconostoc kimchii]
MDGNKTLLIILAAVGAGIVNEYIIPWDNIIHNNLIILLLKIVVLSGTLFITGKVLKIDNKS